MPQRRRPSKPGKKPAAKPTASTLHERGRSAVDRARAIAGAAKQGRAAYETMQRAGQAIRAPTPAARQKQQAKEKNLRRYVRRMETMFKQQRMTFKRTPANVFLLEMSWRMGIPPSNLVEIFRNADHRKLLVHEMNQALKQADQMAKAGQPMERAFLKVAQDLAHFNNKASKRKAA